VDLRVEKLHQRLSVEGDDTGEHLVRDGGQRVAVRRRPNLVPRDLLGRHVGRSARRHTGHRLQRRALEQLGEPEVGEYRRILSREQDVGRLDVAVHDSMAVGVVETRGDPAQVLQGGRLVERALLHPAGEAAAGDVLDDHVGRPLKLAEVVDVDDVGVAQPGDRLRLVAETRHGVGIRGHRLQHLDRPGPLELRVVGAKDHAHGSLSDEVLDLVLA